MSLYFVCGKVGAGKSLYAVQDLLVKELLTTQRVVCTNLALKWEKLQAWFDKHHPEKGILLVDKWELVGDALVLRRGRLSILDKKELTEFYRYRQPWAPLVERVVYEKPEKRSRLSKEDREYDPVCLDFAPWCEGGEFNGQGVCYFLDELQLVYNCRNYADAPVEFPYYLSQHRKVNDDIFVLTQQPQNVDKMFRSFAQQFIYVANLGKIRAGWFKLPGAFRWGAYEEMKTGQQQVASFSGWFRRDPELSECYETGAGIGIVASRADKGEKQKGIPWQVAFAVPIVLICLLFFVPRMSKTVIMKTLPQGSGAAAKPVVVAGGKPMPASPPAAVPATSVVAVAPGAGPRPGVAGDLPFRILAVAPVPDNLQYDDGVRYRGFVEQAGVMTVYLSDGRRFVAGKDSAVSLVTTRFCVVNGRKYDIETARDVEQPSYPAYTKPGAMPTSPAADRSGGVIVGGSPRQY